MIATPKAPRLFTLRLWQEDPGAGQAEWRGKVQALPEGEAYYFCGWPGLIGHLEAMLKTDRRESANSPTQDGDMS